MTLHVTHHGGEIGGLGDHFHIVLTIKQQPQVATNRSVVVGEDDLDRRLRPERVSRRAGRGGQMQMCGHRPKLAFATPIVVTRNALT